MHIAKVNIENFMGIKQACLRLLNTGLVLIQGDNKDDPSANSNGACKSTIPDALSWCLWGETARGIKGDDIINNIAGKETRVQVWLVDGHFKYRISRHRKYPKHKNAVLVHVQDGKDWKDISKGTDKATQDLVVKLMGASKEIFNAAVYAAQDALPDLPAMTDKNLKMIIEEAAGVTVLERAYEIARLKLRSDTSIYEKNTLSIDDLYVRKEEADEAISSVQENIKAWEVTKKEIISQRIAVARQHAIEIVGIMKELKNYDSVDILQKISECDQKINSVTDEFEVLSDLKSTERTLNNNLRINNNDFERNKNEAKSFKSKADAAVSQVGVPCHDCGRPYTENEISSVYKNAIEAARERVTAAKANKVLADECQNKLDAATKAVAAYENGMTDVSSTTQARAQQQKRLTEFTSLQSKLERVKGLASVETSRVKDIEAGENPHLSALEKAVKRSEDCKEKLKEVTVLTEALEKDLEVTMTVSEIYSPSGVRAHILDQVTPFLNERTSHYLGTLSDGLITAVWNTLTQNKAGEYREKFTIEVRKEGGAKIFAGLSGGEKRKVRLSCALAMQDLVASRASKPINLWIGDEIDDALDNAGLERLMGVLEEKAREKGSVLIISHNDIRDWVRDTLTVVREGGVSHVEGVLCL